MTTVAGLRERKKQKTKAAIQRAALRLFKRQGYEETTIEQIAAAAEISESTFFNYFREKEDVVIYDEYDPQIFETLAHGPHDEPLRKSIEKLLDTLASVFEADHDAIYERAKLSLEVPELRAHAWEELEKARDLISSIIASRTGRDASELDVRVVSMAFVGAAFEASIEWVKAGGKGNIVDHLRMAIEAIGFYSMVERLQSV
ncbi:MAG TPA: TetR family transcriptional regulator [Candidatus Dormibacteraeota bacterium]|nr:TetR family transcriptional regulator [Candidatus Dormibacteraeota bacterium]